MTLLEALRAQQTRNVAEEKSPRDTTLLKTLIGPGPAGLGLQVVVGEWRGSGAPIGEARSVHSERLGKKIFPLVVALTDATGAVWIMGPSADATPVGPIPESQAMRILQAGLDEPSGMKGRQRVASLLSAFGSTGNAGIHNSGLFATHFLTEGIRDNPIWPSAVDQSKSWLGLRGEHLISAMGFSARRAASAAHVLTSADSNEPRAIAVLLSEQESFDTSSPRFAVSPVALGLNIAHNEGADWVMVLRGSQIRLYAAKPGVGVGSRGLAETFFELDLAILSDDDGAFLDLAFSAQALGEGGSINQLLEGSSRYAAGLGERLRQRVYNDVVPELSVAVAGQLGGAADLERAYRLSLRILFRLLFQAYAEDGGLLPYKRNERYTRNSLKRWARDFVEQPTLIDQLDRESHAIWDDLRQVWGVIDTGNKTWDVPPYNGGLFGSDPRFHPEGALIEEMELDDGVIGHALRHLLVDVTPDGALGPVDFRSLTVREFGTIYEGLLESSLSRTDVDLTLDNRSAYVPAKKKDRVLVGAGSIYFHNKSGERKATGSYFTPGFAVAHLLERALEPTLQGHLDRVAALLEAGDEAGAEEKFFDFRIADLAMGSGHFLVSAIDTIEAGMSAFLAEHNLPGVTDELRRLEQAARSALGHDEADYEIEPSVLLRRQIARRCIYGLDLNEVAVELARVGVWIHTFVPGLPMSTLDHNLVCANSLTGIGTVEEALDALEPDRKPGQPSMITMEIEKELVQATGLLLRAANTSEANKAEVVAAAAAAREAAERAYSVKLIFDAAVAARTGMLGDLKRVPVDELRELAERPVTQRDVAELQPGHMPYLFPEVFVRENPGFDCILGNPPWEKLHVEEHAWWGLRFPGLHRGGTKKEMETSLRTIRNKRPDLVADYESTVERVDRARQVIARGPYPGIGAAHIDLYQAFAWRFWHLLREGGLMGVVLPRGALSGVSTTEWRRAILDGGGFEDVSFLTNNREWVFKDVHMSYTLALATISKGPGGSVSFCGPFYSLDEWTAGRGSSSQVSRDEFKSWSNSFAFPFVPNAAAGEVMQQMSMSPRFSDSKTFDFRAVQGDLNASADRDVFTLGWPPEDRSAIAVLAGSSVNMWAPDASEPYGWADSKALLSHLINKARSSQSREGSPYFGLVIERFEDLPIFRPRVVFKDVTSPTNTRSAIACLLPPLVATVHSAPVLVRRRGDVADEAYLLGVMCSLPFDWYIRRWVELHLTFGILYQTPVPHVSASDQRRLRIVDLAARLSAKDGRFAEWADAIGVPVSTLEAEPERSHAIAEIDALVALLYGLSWTHVEHIFGTFHRGWNYSERLAAVRKHYEQWDVA